MADRILVIEKDDELREELASSLAEAGFSITAVSNYSANWLIQKELHTDLIIMDAVLPGINIVEACQQIRNTLDIPVVLLGEGRGDDAWDNAVKADVVLYETKPFSHRMLAAKLKVILRRYKGRRTREL